MHEEIYGENCSSTGPESTQKYAEKSMLRSFLSRGRRGWNWNVPAVLWTDGQISLFSLGQGKLLNPFLRTHTVRDGVGGGRGS